MRSAATILFAGPMAAGVGITADIFADVARLSHRTVTRRRDFTHLAFSNKPSLATTLAKTIVLQLVSFGDAEQTADSNSIDIAIAWDDASAAALRAAGIEAGEWIIVDSVASASSAASAQSTVPHWRRDLLTDAARSPLTVVSPLQRTARALKSLSVRTPFTRELWQRVLKLHVPARRRRAAAADFSA